MKAGIGREKGEAVGRVEGVIGGLMGAGMGVAVRVCGAEVELYVAGLS